MNNFESRLKQPWTTYDNRLIQRKTIFENPAQKMGYLYLASYANAAKIFPSIDSISDAICSSKRTAMRVIQQLEEIGLIEVVRTPGKSNQYILNDYFEVEEELLMAKVREKTTSDKMSPVPKQTSANMSPPTSVSLSPVTKSHTITKTSSLNTSIKNKSLSKTKTSSSPDKINDKNIDQEFKAKYPDRPFDEIKYEILKDDSLTITNEKQYRGILNHRLKNWSPNKTKKNQREERVPEWFDINKQKKKEAVPAANLNIDEERRKLLEEINQ